MIQIKSCVFRLLEEILKVRGRKKAWLIPGIGPVHRKSPSALWLQLCIYSRNDTSFSGLSETKRLLFTLMFIFMFTPNLGGGSYGRSGGIETPGSNARHGTESLPAHVT